MNLWGKSRELSDDCKLIADFPEQTIFLPPTYFTNHLKTELQRVCYVYI